MRNYMIFNVSELPLVDFEQVLETSSETVRKSVDGSKTFVKWVGEEIPSSIQSLITKEGPYTNEQILEILNTEEWRAIPTFIEPIIVPKEVAAWRIRAITTIMGLSSQIDTILSSLPEPNKTIANYAWFQGTVIERHSPTALFIAQQLQLTEEQVDNIFIEATNIVI